MNAAAETGLTLNATWSGLLPVLLAAVTDGETAKSRNSARAGLVDMARAADIAAASYRVMSAVKDLLAAIELHRDCMSGEIHRGEVLDESIDRVNKTIAEYEAAHGC